MDNASHIAALEAKFHNSVQTYIANRDSMATGNVVGNRGADSGDDDTESDAPYVARPLGDVAAFTRFVRAGNATFTVRNAASGNRFTFKVSKPKQSNGPASFFVGVMNGPDNERSYAYMGMIKNTQSGEMFTLTGKSKVTREAPSYNVFATLWRIVQAEGRLPRGVEIWHEGRCGRCGRKLTVPESIESGYGEKCRDLVGM